MVNSAQVIMQAVVSLGAIRWYVRELLKLYTDRLLNYSPLRDVRSIRFRCEPTVDITSCRVPGSARRRRLKGTRCFFTDDDGSRAFETLHDAAEALLTEDQRSSSSATAPVSASGPLGSARDLICSLEGRTNARALRPPRWCFDFMTPVECHAHKVPSTMRHCPNRRERACMWRPGLRAMGMDESAICASSKSSLATSAGDAAFASGGGACVAVCGCEELCNTARSP